MSGAEPVPPLDEVRSYYGRPVVKHPEWTWEVPWYLFFGGLAGASSVVSLVARLTGNPVLADRTRLLAAAGAAVSPPLLMADLGRPSRFHHMLRVFKPRSAMSMGSWILAGFSAAAVVAGGLGVLGRLPRLGRLAEVAAGVLGPPMTTYTGALFADTSIPVWHEARRELPFVFASSAATAAGAAAILATPPEHAGPARRLAVGGAVAELAAVEVMEHRLGALGDVYDHDDAGRWSTVARTATATGATCVALGGRRRPPLAAAGAALLLVGSVAQRWAVYRAGFLSAADPAHTIGPQRARKDAATRAEA